MHALPEAPRAAWVVVGGVVEKLKKKITRGGEPMLFVTIADTTGPFELLVFPRTFAATREVWQTGTSVCVVGRTTEAEGDDKLFVERAYLITAATAPGLREQLQAFVSPLRQAVPASLRQRLVQERADQPARVTVNEGEVIIHLTAEEIRARADQIKKLLAEHPGSLTLYLEVAGKRIKTSYQVTDTLQLREQLERLFTGDH